MAEDAQLLLGSSSFVTVSHPHPASFYAGKLALLASQCSQQQHQIASLSAENITLRNSVNAHISRCLELEGLVSNLKQENLHLEAEKRSLAASLNRTLNQDATLQGMAQKLQETLVALEQDNRVLSEQLHNRTAQGGAMVDLLQRQRYLLMREKNEADRAAAVVGAHQEWILRSHPITSDQSSQPWIRHDALPPGAPTLSSAAPTLPASQSGVPRPRVLSAQEVTTAAAVATGYGTRHSIPLPIVQAPQPLIIPRVT